MKIKLYKNWPLVKNWSRKIFMIMRMTIIIMLLSVTQLLAVESYSQNVNISLNIDNIAIKDVLSEIQKQTEFSFMFNSKIVDVDRKVNIRVENEKINKVLDNLFAGTDISYIVLDRQIIIYSNKTATQQQQKQKLTGKVTDNNGATLPGASVVVQGTNIGVVTNANGEFTINVSKGTKLLTVSFIGMKNQKVAIGNKISFVIVDLLAFKDDGYDYAILYSVYPYFEDKRILFKHILSLLNKSGKIIMAHYESKEKINNIHSHNESVKNFFIDNYDKPIFEEGIQLVDMVYLRKDFKIL